MFIFALREISNFKFSMIGIGIKQFVLKKAHIVRCDIKFHYDFYHHCGHEPQEIY